MIWIIVGSDKGGGTQAVAKRVFNLLKVNNLNKLKLIYMRGTSNGSSTINYLGSSGVLNGIPRLYKKILKEKPKQIICFNQEASLLLIPICKVFKIRLISRCMNTPSMRLKDKALGYKARLMTFLFVRLAHLFDAVISQCDGMKKDLINLNPKLKTKIQVIYNPIPVKNENCTEVNSLKHKGIKLLYVGRFIGQKNLKFLIDVISTYNNENETKVHVDLYGDGALKDDLVSFSESVNSENNIHFKGYCSNNKIPFSLYDGLILTSTYEGFPNVLLEALSNNIKVIAGNIKSGPSEIIAHKQNGWLVESFQHSEWHSGITWLKNYPKSQEKVFIPNHLSDEIILNNYYALLAL